jgi:MFS family permease
MVLAVATLAACALPLFFTASLALHVQRDLGMSDAQIGLAITAFWIAATLASPPAGRLVDRIGPARSVRLAGVLVALPALAIAGLARSFVVFALLLAVTGVGNALVSPGMSALIAADLRPGRRGTLLGLQQSGPPLAGVAAGLSLPIATAALGWRWVFALGAAAAALATGAVRGGHGGREQPVRGGPRPRPGGDARAFSVLLALGGLLAAAAANGLVAYLVVYAAAGGFSTGAAGILLGAAGIACAVTRIGLGALADRRRLPLLAQMAFLVLGGAAGFGLLAVGATWTTVVGSLLAIGVGWGWAGLYILAAVEQGAHAPGRAVGAAVSGPFAGAIVGPLVVGLLGSSASFELAWVVCAAISVASAAALAGACRIEPVPE